MTPADVGIGVLFERMREAAIVADVRDERIVLWNPAAVLLFGYSADDAVGLPLEVLVPHSLRSAHRDRLAVYRLTGRGAVIDSTSAVQVPALRRDGIEVADQAA